MGCSSFLGEALIEFETLSAEDGDDQRHGWGLQKGNN
jgi:hypothetical protein